VSVKLSSSSEPSSTKIKLTRYTTKQKNEKDVRLRDTRKEFAHEVRIIGPRKVKAFLQGKKTDANDALAAAVAVMQAGMVFSLLKSEDQQILQSIGTSRKFIDKQLVALMNHMRAYLYEYGITTARGKKSFSQSVANILGGIVERYSELSVSLIPPLSSM